MAKAKDSKRRGQRGKNRANRSPLPWILGGTAVVVLIAVPIVLDLVRRSNLPGEFFSSQGNTHIQLGQDHPSYNSDPPTSGWHTGDLLPWGSYDYTVPDERVIHNMEDGGVLLWYRLGTAEENAAHIEALEDLSRRYDHIVVLPREDMPTAYAFTAWTRLQRFEAFDEEAMLAFIKAFHGIDNHVRSF